VDRNIYNKYDIMKKEINEKTFELNITNELLDLSKSFIWYLEYSPFCHLIQRDIISQFLNQHIFFANGLTQEEENNYETGGYDVSINFRSLIGHEDRLMFLQYKSGERKKYSNNSNSKFYRVTTRTGQRTPEHVAFTFNDAAEGTQHSTLRNLANKPDIQSQSVLYVFPRITEKVDFINKIGQLIHHTSFVPVLDLDKQAANQIHKLEIIDGFTHKYRTSYDGSVSEVNYFYYTYLYNDIFISNFLSELICIQIERLLRITAVNRDKQLMELFVDLITQSIERLIENRLKDFIYSESLRQSVNMYIEKIRNEIRLDNKIPNAPSEFTTIITIEGLKINLDKERDYSSISYQIF
jgi:hypothetical protein